MVLEPMPLPAEQPWRAYEYLSNTAAGFVVTYTVAPIAPAVVGPVLTTVLAQTRFGFAHRVASWVLVLGFRGVIDTFYGWGFSDETNARLVAGG